jgi:hypothetical protein
MTRTFDYVAYDEIHTAKQTSFKEKFMELESKVLDELVPGRARSLIATKLEEAYMWVGKAIRDNQIAMNDSADCPQRTAI